MKANESPQLSADKAGGERPRPATELWFREEDTWIASAGPLASVRSGDRTEDTPDPKGGYRTGEFVRAKILRQDGSFDDARSTEILITGTRKNRLAELGDEDLSDAPPDERTREAVIRKLSSRYGTAFDENAIVTVVKFRDAERIENAEDLIKGGALRIAKLPRGNPEHINFPEYTLPLIADDYPAKTAVMWNAAYRAFGIDSGNVMLVGNPAYAEEILAALKKDGRYVGGGVGVGFKDEAVRYIDTLDPLAKAIGSVNFILS